MKQSLARYLLPPRVGVPTLVAVLGLAATIIVAAYMSSVAEGRERLRFQNQVQRAVGAIEGRISAYVAMLRAGSGLFVADSTVSRDEFNRFVQRLRLDQDYPGIQGIGYAAVVDSAGRDPLLERLRVVWGDTFRFWGSGGAPTHTAILYLEPLDRRNQAALGYDMWSEPTRREAMARARDSGRAAASGRVRLVQEIDRRIQSGFLIYVPVYRGGMVPDRVAERRARLVGFVYSPFRAGDLLNGIFPDWEAGTIGLRIYDGAGVDTSRLLHAVSDGAQEMPTAADFTALRAIDVAGRRWTLQFWSRTGFAAAATRELVWLVVGGGLLVTLLLYLLSRQQALGRERAEQIAADLRASEDRFRSIVAAAPDVIYMIDAVGTLTMLSPAFEKVTGWSTSEWVGRSFLPIVASDDHERAGEIFLQLLAGDIPETFELKITTASGEERIGEFRSRPIMERGRVIGAIGVARDVTERRHSEDLLRQAHEEAEAANRAKDRFLAVLSHELRTPLTPVLNAVHLLAEDATLDAMGRDLVEMIGRNVELEARLIDDLLDVTRIASGKLTITPEPVALHPLVRSALRIVADEAQRRGQELVVETEATNDRVKGDGARLQQVFWNLLQNGVKFTPDGGRISLRTWNEAGPDGGEEIVVEVKDTGVGIPPEVIDRIFNPFEQGETTVTRRYGGLGLGLAICRTLVELHGGRIEARSDGAGEGAIFMVRLPTLPATGA